MDRHDPSNPNQRPSIFSRPEDDEQLPSPPRGPELPDWHDTAIRPHGAIRPPDAPPRPAAGPRRPSNVDAAMPAAAREGLSRQVIILGSMALAIVALSGYIGVSLLRSSEGPTPFVAATSSITARPSVTPVAEPTEFGAAATSSPTPTPRPTPTPEPTPAGPPSEVAVGGWATVTVGELHVRRAAGQDSESVYRLAQGAIVHVAEGPTVVGTANWYRIASLGGATGWTSSGWEIDPYLETIVGDPRLSECGQVRRPVFASVDGSPTPDDPLRIGDFALPAAAFENVSLGAIELLRGMGDEVCFTAQLGADGMPRMGIELAVTACGHAVADGTIYRLEPTDDKRVPLASQVMDSTVVHPSLLDGGPADHRMSTNLRTIVSMMANDGTSGCVNASVTQRADAIDSHRSVSANQCSIVEVYNEHSIKLSPASGGPTAWIKLPASSYQRGLFPLEQRVMVSVDASASDQDRWAGAWPQGNDGCG